MPHSWPLVPLGDVLTKSSETTDVQPTKQYKQVTVRLWGKGVTLRAQVLGNEIAADRQYIVRKDQFITSRIDARNGAFGLIPIELDGAIVSNDFPVFNLDGQKILPAFLDWMSKTQDFIDRCRHASEGTTNRVRLKEDLFMAVAIPLPPLGEQRRIVARIAALATRISEARGLRAAAEITLLAMTAASYKLVTDELEENAPMQPLGEIVDIQGGNTPSKANPLFWNGNIPWMSPKDMKSKELIDAYDHISKEALSEGAKLIRAGSVLIVIRGMILARIVPVCILATDATINQDIKALVPNDSLDTNYLYAILLAFNSRLLALVEKSTHDTRKLETPNLMSFPIPVPPLSEQRHIVAYLDEVQARVDAIKALQSETAAELAALLPSVLDRAFRGEL